MVECGEHRYDGSDKDSEAWGGGHVIRMRDSEMPETVLSYTPQGKRRVGRPEVRWTDVVNNDMRKAGARDQRTAAKDRDG